VGNTTSSEEDSSSGIFAHAKVGDQIPEIFGAWILHCQNLAWWRVNVYAFCRADAASNEVNAILTHITLFSD
jgi:hypothetical protein